MSTFIDNASLTKRIESIQDLHGYFQSFSKIETQELVGIECELFGVNSQTGKPLPYSGHIGVERVLNELSAEFGYEPVLDSGHTIALKRNGTIISLEPGGQVELSAAPCHTIHQVKKVLDQFFFELKTIAKTLGSVTWIATGIHPFASLDDIEWVPKERYKIMARYLGARGNKAHDMMKRTATDQVNLDYLSEKDAIEKMRVSLAITPIVAAMFANSSISNGKVNAYASERLSIWRDTDPERCGLILNLMCPTCTFDDYLNFVLDIPLMFLVRNSEWISPKRLTFRKFIEHGYQGHFATLTDFELHLSTIFTEVRFKQYMEIRGMDGQRSHLIPAVSAFWKGILYDSYSQKSALNVTYHFKENDIKQLHQDVERLGLAAKIGNDQVLDLARELVKISEAGLRRQSELNGEGQDETIYLNPLKDEILAAGKTPGEQAAQLWEGSFKRNPKALINYLKI